MCGDSRCTKPPSSQEQDSTLPRACGVYNKHVLCTQELGLLAADSFFFAFCPYVCVSSGSIWGPIPYKVSLLDQLTSFQQRHIYLRLVASNAVGETKPSLRPQGAQYKSDGDIYNMYYSQMNEDIKKGEDIRCS